MHQDVPVDDFPRHGETDDALIGLVGKYLRKGQKFTVEKSNVVEYPVPRYTGLDDDT